MRRIAPLLVVFFLICGLASLPATAWGAPPEAKVAEALDALDSYLGTGSAGDGWRSYLNTSALREQLAHPDEADRRVVADVLARFESGAAGLERSQFQQVRASLRAWHTELSLPTREELPELARAAAAEFHAKGEADVQQAAGRATAAMQALDRYLGRGAAGEGWRNYLQWSELQAQVGAEEPDPAKLEAAVARLGANQPGLERPRFLELHEALRGYIDAIQVATNPQVREEFERQAEVLAEALAAYREQPTHELAQTIAGRIGWFERMDQAPALVAGVRRHHSHPNFFAYASGDLLKAALEKPVDRTNSITDNFQGTRIVGTGRTTGDMKVELVPDDERAVFDILFFGRTISNTRGYNGPVTVSTSGTTRLSARKRIRIDADGLSDLPATAAAVTRTQTTGIDSGGGLLSNAIQREAQSRIAGSRPAAEAHGAEMARRRIRAQVDEQAGEFLTRANHNFAEKFRAPLVRQRAFPSLLAFHTTPEAIYVRALQANASQIAAPAAAPELSAEGDLGLRLHSSLVNNAAAVLLGGRTLTEEETNDLLVRTFGEMPEELESEDAEPWSITLARQNPFTVRFERNRVHFVLSGRRYTSGDRTFGAMDVEAAYELVPQGDELLLRRVGEVAIHPPGFDPESTRLSSSQVTLRTLLRKRFEQLLKPEIEIKRFALPGEFAAAGEMGFRQAISEEGWLLIALGRVDDGSLTAASTGDAIGR